MTIARNVVIIPVGAAADTCRAWSGLIADAIPSVIDLRVHKKSGPVIRVRNVLFGKVDHGTHARPVSR